MTERSALECILPHGACCLARRDVFYDIMCVVTWDVEFTDEFYLWWCGLTDSVQDAIAARVQMLERMGPSLGFPYSSRLVSARVAPLRELRVQHRGRPYRVLYAFDPRRTAILLLGGDKTGDDQFYDVRVRRAEALYEEHLRQLVDEGRI